MVEQNINDSDIKRVEAEVNALDNKEKENKELTERLAKLESDRQELITAKETEIAKLKESMGIQEKTFKEHITNLNSKFDEFDKKWDEFVPDRKGVTNTSDTNPNNTTPTATDKVNEFINSTNDPRDWIKDKEIVARVKDEFKSMLESGGSIQFGF